MLAGLPFVFVVYKICAGLRVEEPRKKKKTKKEQAEEADDPMAWFAGKLNDMAVAREEAKAAQSQEAKGLTPEDLWNMLDANKDGILSMGEFKKGVQKNNSLQYLLFTGNNPDVATMKSVFKQMHVRRQTLLTFSQLVMSPAFTSLQNSVRSYRARCCAWIRAVCMADFGRSSIRMRHRSARPISSSTGERLTRTKAVPSQKPRCRPQ